MNEKDIKIIKDNNRVFQAQCNACIYNCNMQDRQTNYIFKDKKNNCLEYVNKNDMNKN